MEKDPNQPEPPDERQAAEGHLLLNIGKIVLLVVVLAAFWYFFDRWLTGK